MGAAGEDDSAGEVNRDCSDSPQFGKKAARSRCGVDTQSYDAAR